ncbi:MAG: TIGR02302 family protein [Proteobacteria bacterium]|nr:TIGR02302 family protein [Pseudomonadota bacterium]
MSAPESQKLWSLDGALAWRTRWTWAALLIERAVPLALPVLLVPLAFVALAWAGLFEWLEAPVRAGIGIAALILMLVLALRLRALRLPTREEVNRRLDASRPEAHRPLETLADTNALADPIAAALWREHQARAHKAALGLEAASADPGLRRLDPLAVRMLVLLALVAGAFIAGKEREERLAFALDWSSPRGAITPPRLDAWLDPPAYTGRPPIFLTREDGMIEGPVLAPVGSVLFVRASGTREGKAASVTLEHGPGLGPAPAPAADAKPERLPAGVTLEKRIVKADAPLAIKLGRHEMARLEVKAIPDLAPQAILKDVTTQAGSTDRQTPGGLRLTYELKDDYGIAKGGVVMESSSPRTLFPPPEVALPLRLGAGDLVIPTEDHPWAGAAVTLRLTVEDDIGQKGTSESRQVTLPGRPFSHPLARALVEQRRLLVFSPDERDPVLLALDALLFAPEKFTPNAGDVVALTAIRAGLRKARTDERLREIADTMYDYARYLEDGDMSEAEKRLRDAEARLREAIERGAPPEEIARLSQEMRRAMDNYLRDLAKRSEQDPNARNAPNDPNAKTITPRDLAEMMKKIEEAARQGNQAEAQRLLKQLSDMMKNLRSARRQNGDPQQREMGEQMRELEQLQRDQRDLKDRTFRQDRDGQRDGQQNRQGQRQRGQRGEQGESGQQQGQQGGEGSLADQQQALRDRLNKLRERMQNGKGQNGQENGLEDADEGMGDAGKNLGKGNPGGATEGQQKALEGMGRAQEGLAREMERMMGQNEPGDGEGEGLGDQPGPGTRGRAENSTDPLGRPQARENRSAEDNSGVEVPDKDALQGSVSERAARVLRELRRRLGEFERPRDELDYLERLLRRQQ